MEVRSRLPQLTTLYLLPSPSEKKPQFLQWPIRSLTILVVPTSAPALSSHLLFVSLALPGTQPLEVPGTDR